MANFKELDNYYNTVIAQNKRDLEYSTNHFLLMAFRNRKEYAYPDWLWPSLLHVGCEVPKTLIDNDATLAPAAIYAVSFDGKGYRIGGMFCGYGCFADDVHDVAANYAKDSVMEFIAHFIGCNIDKMLDDLYNRIRSCTRMGDIDIVIEDWCQEEGYSFDYIDTQAVTQWTSDRFNKENNK